MENTETHPIQLESISVRQLSIKVWDSQAAPSFQGSIQVQIQSACNEFDEESSTISVGVRAVVGDDLENGEMDDPDEPVPFYMVVEIFGLFTVDTSKFKPKHLPSWGRVNAPFLLLPYLREQVYSLASRAGIKEVIVPLFIQPPPFTNTHNS